MNIDWLNIISLPLIGAFIGWITNLIAVKMLFHPRRPIRLLGMEIHGVFPRRQKDLAQKICTVVAEQLIHSDEIVALLKSEQISNLAQGSIDTYIERAIWEKLPKAVPMVAMFLTPQLVATVKAAFKDEVPQVIDSILHSIAEKVGEQIDIAELVRQKVEAFSVERVEEILLSIMRQEFKFIEVIGGILGFFIGALQLLIVYI